MPEKNMLKKAIDLTLKSLNNEHTHRVYERYLKGSPKSESPQDNFLSWHKDTKQSTLSSEVVRSYITHLRDDKSLSTASINQVLAALRKLASVAAENHLLKTKEASNIKSIPNLREKVRHVLRAPDKTPTILTKYNAQRMIVAPDIKTLKGLRDRALLTLILGCGLHRSEIVNLTFDNLQKRGDRWVLFHFESKRGQARTVPVPAWAKAAIDAYTKAAKFKEGVIFRAIDRWGNIAPERMTDQSVYNVVTEYGRAVGFKNLTPKDLRKTFESMIREAGEGLYEIKVNQDSRETAERLLSLENLKDTPCDRLGLKV